MRIVPHAYRDSPACHPSTQTGTYIVICIEQLPKATYPPAYLELGQANELLGRAAKAADAYDAYVVLAPNYAGTDGVRARAARTVESGRGSVGTR